MGCRIMLRAICFSLFLLCASLAHAQQQPMQPAAMGWMRINRIGFQACVPIYPGMQPVCINARVGLFGLRRANYVAR